MTPPSAIASRNIQAKAGPHPDSAVHASNCLSSRNRQRPIEEKICKVISLFRPSESEGGRVETTVMPSRICQNVHYDDYAVTPHGGRPSEKRTRQATLGMARITVVLGRTQLESCAMVTPVRMLMSNFPAKASLNPSSLRMGCATCGLQLDAGER
jgi:hypothetical protein